MAFLQFLLADDLDDGGGVLHEDRIVHLGAIFLGFSGQTEW
jgi:hypothetical protein